jgi:hypothetical protein
MSVSGARCLYGLRTGGLQRLRNPRDVAKIKGAVSGLRWLPERIFQMPSEKSYLYGLLTAGLCTAVQKFPGRDDFDAYVLLNGKEVIVA